MRTYSTIYIDCNNYQKFLAATENEIGADVF